MVRKLAAAAALVAAASVGMLATPAGAATTCSSLFCFQYGSASGTVWTNVGPLGASVTLVSPVWSVLPLTPA